MPNLPIGEECLPESARQRLVALRDAQTATNALVNDLQMKAHWGFGRGFNLWREFPEGTPEGTCEHITAQALRWLDSAPTGPFFLFLHYYDPHDPYDPPAQAAPAV